MTTLHKVVLSLIAMICITLIVGYSIKGNSHRPQPVAVVVPSSSQPLSPAQAQAKAEADAAALAQAMQQPVHVGPSSENKPAGLDELVAKVRSEIATNAPVSTQESGATIEPAPAVVAIANGPTTAQGDDHARLTTPDDVADFVPQVEPRGDAPLVDASSAPFSSTDTIAEPIADPLTDTTSQPSSASANADASVPTFTLGEPLETELLPGAASGADAGADVADADQDNRSRELLEGSADELADSASPGHSLPPLVRIRSNEETSSDTPAVKEAAATKADAPDATFASAQKTTQATQEIAKANDSSAAPVVVDTVKTTSTPPASATRLRTYTVKSGDSFSSIATKELGAERHWLALVDANPGVDPKRIKVGQVINLPDMEGNEPKAPPAVAKADVAITEKPTAKPTISSEEKIHEVRAGENLSSISRRYYNTPDHWRHIYLTNRELIGSDPGKLHAGLKLKITQPK